MSGLPHTAVNVYKQASGLQINTAGRTTQSTLADQQFFKQETGLSQGFPLLSWGNLITTGA